MSVNRILRARRSRPAPRATTDTSRPGSLWRQPGFRNLWLAGTISDFGFHVTALALPLTAAMTLGASPFQMGLLTAAESFPYVVLGLVAGVVVDRLPRRRLLVLTDWLRATLLAVIPILALTDRLTYTALFAVGMGVGVCSLIFNVAQVSLMPAIIRREELANANGRLEASAASAQAAGPGIAGVLIGALSAPLAIAINAVTFAISGLILRFIPDSADARPDRLPSVPADPTTGRRERATSSVRDMLSQIEQGLRVLWCQPLLRASLLGSTTINLFGYVFLAVYILFMARALGLSSLTVGLILSGGGVGAVAGAVVSPLLRRHLGFGPTMVWAMAICCAASVLVPLAVVVPGVAIPLIAAAEIIQYGTLAVFNIGGRTLRQVYAADAYQGRVNATARTLASGGTLVGSLLGGILGSWLGLTETLVIGSLGMMLALVPVVRSPLPRLVTLPATDSDHDRGDRAAAAVTDPNLE
jgi:MFS family permease